MVLALAAGLVLSGAPLNTIWVAAPPDVAPCTVEVFAGVFRSRLGQVAVLPGRRALWAGEMQLRHDPFHDKRAGASAAGSGRARALPGELPDPGTDCLAASETVALMVERYLEEVGSGISVSAPPLFGVLAPIAPPARWGLAIEAAVTGELAVLPQFAPGESTAIQPIGPGFSLAVGVRRRPRLLSRGERSSRGPRPPWPDRWRDLKATAACTCRQQRRPWRATICSLRARGRCGSSWRLGPSFSGPTRPPRTAVGLARPATFSAFFPSWAWVWATNSRSGRACRRWPRLPCGSTSARPTSRFRAFLADTVYTRALDGEGSLGLCYVFY